MRGVTFFMFFLDLVYNLKFSVEKDSGVFWSFLSFYFLFMHLVFYFVAKKRQKYTFNLEKTYRFYSDRLEVMTNINYLVVSYDILRFAFEDSNTFYMIFENRLMCINKNGFEDGYDIGFDCFIKKEVNFL